MNRKSYIAGLLSYFTGPFLRAVAARDSAAIADLRHCHCAVSLNTEPPSIEFSPASLFDALLRHAAAQCIAVPSHCDWNKDFKEFCRQLMVPWPIEQFHAAGYQTRLVYKSNHHAKCRYELQPYSGSSGRCVSRPATLRR